MLSGFVLNIHWMWVQLWVYVLLCWQIEKGEQREHNIYYSRFYVSELFCLSKNPKIALLAAQPNQREKKKEEEIIWHSIWWHPSERSQRERKKWLRMKYNKAKMNTKWEVSEHVSLFIIESICWHQAIWRYRMGTNQIRRFFECWQFIWRQIWWWRYIYLSVYVTACQKCFEWFRWDATI